MSFDLLIRYTGWNVSSSSPCYYQNKYELCHYPVQVAESMALGFTNFNINPKFTFYSPKRIAVALQWVLSIYTYISVNLK